ncbi:MAG: pilus assembly protein PilM [Victivallales bacterium]|nr:pilus assembly protein PilM [Victivallales bacterium]
MQNIKRSNSIGLDIGQTGTKVICLARHGRKVVVKKAEIFRSREEGILGDDEKELLQAVSGWLKELKLIDKRLVVGLPQYMSTMQVSDFAPGAKGDELEKMVSLETTQLSGFSDDSFIHDYAVMPPGNGRVNPVLIGICREANINDYVDKILDVSIKVEDVAMNGLALANAFMELHPKESQEGGVQLLLDIGTENTTLVIMSSGQVLYIGSMMFGGRNVTQQLAEQLGITLDEAEKRKLKGEIDWASLNLALLEKQGENGVAAGEQILPDEKTPEGIGGIGSLEGTDSTVTADDNTPPISGHLGLKLPKTLLNDNADDEPNGDPSEKDDEKKATAFLGGMACFQVLLRELDNCLEHWRSSENESLVNEKIKKIWICGGGAMLDQVGAYLSISHDCETEILGPQLKTAGETEPEFTLAYGLALQGLGMAKLPISLTPFAMTWIHKREQRVKFLVAAFLLLFAVLFGWFFFEYQRLVDEIIAMDEDTELMRGSVRQLQVLDGMKRDYSEILLNVLPIVSSTCRTQIFLTALERLQTAVKDPNFKECVNWCVYMADTDSFNEYNAQWESRGATPLQPATSNANGGRRGRRMLSEQPEVNPSDSLQRWQEIQKEEQGVINVIDAKPLEKLYVVGVIMSKNDNHNVIEREIMLNLENDGDANGEKRPSFFSEVQVMNEDERSKCRNRAVLDWEKCFANMRTSEAFKSYDYKPFFLRLGLRETVIRPPKENPLEEQRKSKKKKK